MDIGIDPYGALIAVGRQASPFEDLVIIKYPSINTNQWYHVVVNTSGSTVSLWLDGINVATGQIAGYADGKRITTSNTWAFGAIYTPCSCVGTGQIFRELDGSIDDVRFYDRVLTEDEIKTLNNQRS